MRTIYSLKEFYDAAKDLAATKGIDYVSVRVQFNSIHGLEFSCYAHGTDWYTDNTQEGAIEQLRNKLYPIQLADRKDDVEIDLPDLIPT